METQTVSFVIRNIGNGQSMLFSESSLPDVMGKMFNVGQSEEATARTIAAMHDVREGLKVTNGVFEVYRNDIDRTAIVDGGQKALIKALKNAKRAANNATRRP